MVTGKPDVVTTEEPNGEVEGMEMSKLNSKDKQEKKGLKDDYGNIILLFVIYFLQEIPLGISYVIPLMLVNKGVPYTDQALFSLAFYPFSVKLLWAPLVDSCYSNKFGRRKSWMVPMMYGIASMMIIFSLCADHLIGNSVDNSSSPNIPLLTFGFLILAFLIASQDVAIDGWAVTNLSKEAKEYAASCNSVGVHLGLFTGNTVFLALESPTFCNKFLRSVPQEEGMVTLSGYVMFWAVVLIVVTTIVMIFKHEPKNQDTGTKELSFIETCQMLWGLHKLPTVRWLTLVLLTQNIGIAPDVATELKLAEYGVKRENLGMMQLVMFPFQMTLPWVISKFGLKNPLKAYLYAYPIKLLFSASCSGFVWWTSTFDPCKGFPFYFYVALTSGSIISMIPGWCCWLAMWSVLVKVADPIIGGTYMTLLTTFLTLGTSWTRTSALYFLKFLTFEWCPNNGYFCRTSTNTRYGNQTCHSSTFQQQVVNSTWNAFTDSSDVITTTAATTIEESSENFTIDGYFVETGLCLIIGLLWINFFGRKLMWLEKVPKSMWRCRTQKEEGKNTEETSI